MMKISKKLLFTSAELINYLKTVKKFSKLEEEILAIITYKYAYQKLNDKDVLIGFPYKENKEREINGLKRHEGGNDKEHLVPLDIPKKGHDQTRSE